MFYAALLLKTLQIPLFLDVGIKNTVNYGVFGRLTFNNLAICSGFCLAGHKKNKKTAFFCRLFSCFCCCCCCCSCSCCCCCCCCCCCYCRNSINHVGAGGPSRSAAWIYFKYSIFKNYSYTFQFSQNMCIGVCCSWKQVLAVCIRCSWGIAAVNMLV